MATPSPTTDADRQIKDRGLQGRPAKEAKRKHQKARKFAEKQARLEKSSANSESNSKEMKKNKLNEPLPEYIEETPKGQKKLLGSLDDVFHKSYNPQIVESAWYDWWEEEGFFKPEFTADGAVKEKGSFVITAPPPNVTGALHCGHAMATALQDTMIRWNRMRGFTTLWVPGCDHAGISTQSIVEKMLWRREKKTRYDLGREEFIGRVWKWKDEYHQKINAVLRRMGGSYDWTREAFTMDSNLSAAVTETFCRLHDEGYIYRSNKLVNWCPYLNTALSNVEVVNQELPGRTFLDVPGYEKKVEFGVITYFKYLIDGSDEEFIEVATTRPETMLGDTGIAVHPHDKRYQHLIGKNARHPFVDRLLPIIADEYVDMEFGTGAVKITPAHDPNDFQLGTRHNLAFINILNDDGTMNCNAGKYQGQKRFDVRSAVVEHLSSLGLFVQKVDNPMTVPLCEKSKDVIEPLIKPQWWMKMDEMAGMALKAVQDGEIEIRPETAKESYFRWLSNVDDWCLSRQLWWGHQIPAYFVRFEGETNDTADNVLWVTGRTEDEAYEKAEMKFGHAGKKFELVRDPDVLDTWFSSGLWPFATLGWPNDTNDLEKLFPTSVLETGWDILFFWVIRMIMLGVKLTGKVPFKEVYCHSLVCDTEGRKMSKSLGNVIDPVDVMDGIPLQALHDKLRTGNLDSKEVTKATKFQKAAFPQGIPECGADALRFCLVSYCTGSGDNIHFDVKVMHGYRRFCNKIYQATKYVLGKIGDGYVPTTAEEKIPAISLSERWILHKLTISAKGINQALADREFSKATQIAYQFWYDNLCAVYIESSKGTLQNGTEEEQSSARATLYMALEEGLKMIHPFMPFLTEELWQRLPRRPGDATPSIMVASYPEYNPNHDDPASEAAYELVLDCSKAIRSLMAEYSIREKANVSIQSSDGETYKMLARELTSIKSLCGKGNLTLTVLAESEQLPTNCVILVVAARVTVLLELADGMDINLELQKTRTRIQRNADMILKLEALIEAPDFTEKSNKTVQEAEKKRLADLRVEQGIYTKFMEQLSKLQI